MGRPLGWGKLVSKLCKDHCGKKDSHPLCFVRSYGAVRGCQEERGGGSALCQEEASTARPAVGNRLGQGAASPPWWCGAESNTRGQDAGGIPASEGRS